MGVPWRMVIGAPKMKWIPDVLSAANPANSISVERALKQARELIGLIQPMGDNDFDQSLEDKIQATLDDLDFMLSRMAHGRAE